MREILDLVNAMSPYLLLGFFLAGLMHAFLPPTLYRRYLGGNDLRSVVNAALVGVPLPLCSCGVLPTAMSLRREGASRGATVSFLIATPQTGVDSIIATYSLMGLPFAVVRPVAALVTALLGGWWTSRTAKDAVTPSGRAAEPSQAASPALSAGQKMLSALRYAFVDMMQDIGKWLIIGLVVAGVITVFVPTSFFALFADNSLLSMVLVLLFAIPMYLCATGSIPIAVALMMKGLSPGTALVLLMAGPAANVASMLVVGKVLGRRTLLIYLASIVGGAVAFGLGIDYLLPREWFSAPQVLADACCADEGSWFHIGCTVLLAVLLANAFLMRFRRGGQCRHCQESGETHAVPTMVVRVKGMRCNHCRQHVEEALAALDGAESVRVDLSSGRAEVTGHVSREAVCRAVESLGYAVEESQPQ